MTLDYEIASGTVDCPDVEEFRASVRRQLRYDPFVSAAEHRVAVHIVRKEPGFGGRIRWSDAAGNWVGERRLSSRRSDCGGIAASVAFSADSVDGDAGGAGPRTHRGGRAVAFATVGRGPGRDLARASSAPRLHCEAKGAVFPGGAGHPA